jgi:hypothetical protein
MGLQTVSHLLVGMRRAIARFIGRVVLAAVLFTAPTGGLFSPSTMPVAVAVATSQARRPVEQAADGKPPSTYFRSQLTHEVNGAKAARGKLAGLAKDVCGSGPIRSVAGQTAKLRAQVGSVSTYTLDNLIYGASTAAISLGHAYESAVHATSSLSADVAELVSPKLERLELAYSRLVLTLHDVVYEGVDSPALVPISTLSVTTLGTLTYAKSLATSKAELAKQLAQSERHLNQTRCALPVAAIAIALARHLRMRRSRPQVILWSRGSSNLARI